MPNRSIQRGLRLRPIRQTVLLFAAAAFAIACLATARADDLPEGQAFVLNETATDPMGERHPGTVAWRVDRIKVSGRPDELVIHGDVEIPFMNLTMAMNIRRNADSALPASHTIDMKIALRPGNAGSVSTVPGVMMKFKEKARGTPLNALSVKVTEGWFLLGLSNQQSAYNLRLLQERAWFDIPMVYANGRRGILVVSKGCQGEDVFHEVLAAWTNKPAETGRVSACATASSGELPRKA